jgi:predicted alpha/beta-fold hydrolase
MYSGVRSSALEAMSKGFREYDVEEIAFTGHSLGAAMCYLLALEIMTDREDLPSSPFLPTSLPLKLAVFGSPRIGNLALSFNSHYIGRMLSHRIAHATAKPQSTNTQ